MKRLKKNPEIEDYVVETLAGSARNESEHVFYNYFIVRDVARAFAKKQNAKGFRTRIFHAKFTLVSDSKRKSKKGKKK